MSTKSQALEGLKVADFSWYIVGPAICLWLAHHGAETIRIESLTRPDEMRGIPPFKDGIAGINRSGSYANYNSNKYGMALNLNHPMGVEVAKKLVAWADILVESFTPGTMEKWGLNYEELQKINKGLIMLSTSMQGQTGPEASRMGFGVELASLAGFTHFLGWPDKDVVGMYGAYTDTIAFPIGFVAVMAALEDRRRTGQGQWIDLSQLEASLQYLAPAILDYSMNGRIGNRMGNRHPCAVPHGAYRCKGGDRWCAIAVFTDEEWEAFREVVGKPAWTEDSTFVSAFTRKEHESELDQLVENWTINFTAEEVASKMQAAGIAAGVVENGKDLHDDPQLKHRHHYWVLDHAEMGPCTYDSPPFKLSDTPAEPRMPAPCLGQHTHHVCTKLLGMHDEEFIGLLNSGCFE